MKAPGNVYLIGSLHGGTVREVLQRVQADLGSGPVTVATSFAALPHVGASHDSPQRMMSSAMPAGTNFQRFSVDGEDGAMSPREAEEVIARADILFFGGGDPVLAAERLVRAGADEWVRAARTRGAACVGLSAGSIALGAFWASWPDDEPLADPSIVRCMGVVPGLVVDCHAEADDWEELRVVQRALRLETGPLQFIGIGSGGAVIVDHEGALEWLGKPTILPGL